MGTPQGTVYIRCRTAKGCMAVATRLNKSQSLNKGKNCSTLRVEGSPLFRFLRGGGGGHGGWGG